MPGVGKTRLAVRSGHVLMRRGQFTEVQLAVDLRGYDSDRPPADPSAVLEGFLRELGVPGDQVQHLTLAGRAAKYQQLLAGKSMLVLLDNAASAEQVTPLLPSGPGCLTFVTSRRVLADLPPVHHLALDVLTLEDAVDLLRHGGGDGAVDARPDLAADVAQRLGFLPLALALVAGRIRANPEWALSDHLDRLVHYQQSLRVDNGVEAAISLSYHELTADEKRAFRTLALHPGGDIDSDAAGALFDLDGPSARNHLEHLTAASLLQRPTPGRYRFHNLINIYATARAYDEDPASARRAALTRLSEHYLYTAGLAIDLIYPARQGQAATNPPTSLARCAPARSGRRSTMAGRRLTSLLAVAIDRDNRSDAAIAFATTLHPYLAMSGHYRDAEILHDLAVTAARQSADRASEAGSLISLADLYLRTGRYEQAVDHLGSA